MKMIARFTVIDNTLQCEACGKRLEFSELRALLGYRCELCVLAGNKPKPEYKNPVYGEDTDGKD